MRMRIGAIAALAVTLAALAMLDGIAATPRAADGKIAVVAAENFYGDVAQQIGGARVSVTSILNNPEQDPHLFEVSPTVVRRVAGAQIVIYNGADYDPWMKNLLQATPKSLRAVIVAADLMHKRTGDNPHLWYDPGTMPRVAAALAAALIAADPAHEEHYTAQLETFLASLDPLNKEIASIRGKYAGVSVTATEPVFGYMATALELKMHNERFQLAIMNDIEPSARDLAVFERDLKTRAVRVMFYNKQASSDVVRHLVDLARTSNIAVVGVTETCPRGSSYRDWMLTQLDEVEAALSRPGS